MRVWQVCLIVVAVALVALWVAMRFLFSTALARETKFANYAESKAPQEVHIVPDADWLASKSEEIWRIEASADGTPLAAHCYRAKSPSKNWFVGVHGFRASYDTISPQARLFDENFNCNVLLIDQRAHGLSGGDCLTMGFREQSDVVDWTKKICAEDADAKIALLGVSMGAATVMCACGADDLPPNVVCAVEDCGYSSIREQYVWMVRNDLRALSPFVVALFQIYARAKIGLEFDKKSAAENLAKCRVPMLFIHGDADIFVPFKMLEKNFGAMREGTYKEKLIVPGASHAVSFFVDNAAYKNAVCKFVGKYL